MAGAALTWISGTLAVLALVLLLGRLGQWALRRGAAAHLAAATVGQWRVGADARVRAVRVLGCVYVLYERGRETTLLTALAAADFDTALQGSAPAGPLAGILGLAPGKGRSRVAAP
jgi:hypothetical protein